MLPACGDIGLLGAHEILRALGMLGTPSEILATLGALGALRILGALFPIVGDAQHLATRVFEAPDLDVPSPWRK